MSTVQVVTDEQRASVEAVRASLEGDPHWASHPAFTGDARLHLAIFIEPYLSLLLSGTKTIESRFSMRRTVPWHQVHRGDALLLKRSSGPIVGVCDVADVWSLELDDQAWRRIDTEFAKDLCLLEGDAESLKGSARYATLVRIHHVRRVPEVPFVKRDRRGWVVL